LEGSAGMKKDAKAATPEELKAAEAKKAEAPPPPKKKVKKEMSAK